MDIINPEGLELANCYLRTLDIEETARELQISPELVTDLLEKKEVKRYIDKVFIEQGYRNKFRLGALLDKIIDSKIAEAEETDIYSNKDLF